MIDTFFSMVLALWTFVLVFLLVEAGFVVANSLYRRFVAKPWRQH